MGRGDAGRNTLALPLNDAATFLYATLAQRDAIIQIGHGDVLRVTRSGVPRRPDLAYPRNFPARVFWLGAARRATWENYGAARLRFYPT